MKGYTHVKGNTSVNTTGARRLASLLNQAKCDAVGKIFSQSCPDIGTKKGGSKASLKLLPAEPEKDQKEKDERNHFLGDPNHVPKWRFSTSTTVQPCPSRLAIFVACHLAIDLLL